MYKPQVVVHAIMRRINRYDETGHDFCVSSIYVCF